MLCGTDRELSPANSELDSSPVNAIRVFELAAPVDFMLTFFVSNISS